MTDRRIPAFDGSALRCLIAALLVSYATGCASVSKSAPSSATHASTSGSHDAANASDESDEESDSESANQKEPTVSSLTLDSNEKVEAWIHYFSKKDRERFQRYLDRGQKYRKIVEDVLVENDLPPELYFLALIESGYSTHATSSARAVGVWQFMPKTARHYGLLVDRHVDERRDPIRATEAAAKYLRDLYNIFGSWQLAMAAYNAGEYRVIRSILNGKSRDYWTLVSAGVLPKETSDYVAKLMAAATIGADPEKYGFAKQPGESYPELEAIEVPSQIRLGDLAKHSDLELERLREFNPHLTGQALPAHESSYEVWFPKENAAKLQPQLAALAQAAPKVASRPARSIAVAKQTPRANYHRVKAGENLTQIAKHYGLSVNYLMKVNSLRSAKKIHPGMNLRITSRTYSPQNVLRYRVKRGESLERIARRFGVTIKQVKEDNSLGQNRIYPGQVLMIRKNQT